MRNRSIITGIIAFLSPIPMVLFTTFWSWFCFFGIGKGLLNYDYVPGWIFICSFLPIFISPALGVLGIVHGFVKRKEKFAWLGILLSILCLVENYLLIYGIFYLAKRY